MIVQVATLDILTERAHLEPGVARAIGEAIAMEVTHVRDTLVTQSALALVRTELKQDIADLRAELKSGFATLRLEMQRHQADIVRWMFAGFLSIFLAMLGAAYFMLQSIG
jgi:hypothetical protein